MSALRPFVPGIDEYEALVRATFFEGAHHDFAQPDLVNLG